MTHEQLFSDMPVSFRLDCWWDGQDVALLDSAAAKILAHGANPWVFIADVRHFEQFAEDCDRAALASFSKDEVDALLDWEDLDDQEWQALGYLPSNVVQLFTPQ